MKVFTFLAVIVAVSAHPYPTGYKLLYPNEPRLAAVHSSELSALPRHFDARTHWPACTDVIGQIQDQGGCGSCWAMAATSVISDRLCITSNGTRKVAISAQDLLQCCGVGEGLCGDGSEGNTGGCGGGDPYGAMKWFTQHGLVTGGNPATNANASLGCKPYDPQSPTIKESSLQCVQKCENPTYYPTYAKDHHYGAKYGYLARDDVSIMKEIYESGPLSVAISSRAWVPNYQTNIFTCPGKAPEDHAVRLLGWGETATGEKYWLLANSWGKRFEDNGIFKIRRGENDCNVKEHAVFVATQLNEN